MNKQKCKGVAGAILGHRYESVSTVEKKYMSADDFKKVIDASDNYNKRCILPEYFMVPIQLLYSKSTFSGYFCKRCGHLHTVSNDDGTTFP